MSLKDIGKKNYTEKWNLFLDIYEDLWKDLQDKPIRLLEMGVYNGNSLRTWTEWFSEAEIIGIDKFGNQKGDIGRSKFHTGDQSDPEFIKNLVDEYNQFDIIIDDAGHIWHEQQKALQLLWPAVKSGGMYMIEDLQTSKSIFWGTPLGVDTITYLSSVVSRFVIGESDNTARIRKIEFYPKLAVLHKS